MGSNEEEVPASSDDEFSSNPPRPPLTEEEKEIIESDKIGDSAYSKKWVLSVLMHLVEDMKSNNVVKNERDNDDDEEKNGESEVTDTLEMDPKLEEELCELWDMTMDTEVSKYLQKEDAIDLILDVIVETKALRKLEICLGILANMACTAEVCKSIVEHSTLSDIVLFHIENPDVRTLIELSRLISVCLSNKDVRKGWIKSLKSHSVVEKLVFILENSLNVELLDIVSDVVDKLLDYDDSILNELSTANTVTIICDVYRRTATKRPQAVQTLLHILQMISTTENGVSALASVEDSSKIARIILIESSKYFTPLDSNLPSLVSSCSILNVLMSADDQDPWKTNKNDVKILSTILSLTEALWDKISHDDHEGPDSAKEIFVHKAYFVAVTEFLVILMDRFVNSELSSEILEKLKEKEDQMSRVIRILKESTNSSSSSVEKMEGFVSKLGAMQENGV